MTDSFKKWLLLLGVSLPVIALDQIAKWLTVTRLTLGESWVPVPAIGSVIRVTRSFNTGAAFGILPNAATFFLILALVTVIVFIVSYPRLPVHAWLSRLSIALIIGGAASNAVDRLRFGHVIDYVHVQLSPTFANISNFADHAITVGVILLLFDQWRSDQRRHSTHESDEAGLPPEQTPASSAETLLPDSHPDG